MQQDQNNISESFVKLQKLLEKLFRADAADLDFGIYRIINQRRKLIEDFIDEELPAEINKVLDTNAEIESDREEIESLAKDILQTLGDNVLDADGNLINETYKDALVVKKYLEAKENLGSPQTRDQREDVVYNHLYTFFSRYYDNGDFIPRRRYSQTERYAIPYNGEEIYLHWANRDQYYVKTGEHFSDYRFKSHDFTVIFNLRDVDIEKDNVKGAKRFFIPLSAETNYDPEADEVCIPFEYRPLTDKEKSDYGTRDQQDKIIDAAEREIIEQLGNYYEIQSELGHEKDEVTLLKKHLRTYIRSNTADFFIHKDLRKFLNRELDVFIKNEVLPLSSLIFEDTNLQEDNLPRVGWIETAKLVHSIATKIIDFLSHIEEFQKRLWLKKKFVLSTEFCLTLDRVPEKFYPEIAQNTAQLEEWKALFAIHEIDGKLIGTDYTEPLSVDFLKENPNFVLDTCHFNSEFKDCLLAHFGDLDNKVDGLLIHGENFQALNLLTKKNQESIKAIYIDPPYNTDASAILYKNNYKDSSWMSLMADRISVSRELLTDNGIFCAAIDDVEAANLRQLLQNLFGKENELGIASVCSNPAGRQRPTGFAPAHEYAMFFRLTTAGQIGRLERTEEQLKNAEIDAQGRYFTWKGLRSGGGPNAFRVARPRLFYPLFVKNELIRIPQMEWEEENRQWNLVESPGPDEAKVLPIKPDGEEMTWGYGVETLQEKLSETIARTDRHGNIRIAIKRYLNEEGMLPKTWWGKTEYSSTHYGTIFLTNMLGDSLAFMFPKSIHLVEDCLRVSSLGINDTVLDYFGGSGTTAHATINLNREDQGKRKYILIEMGHHFDTALMPRIKKAIYAEEWKDAKPVSRESRLPHLFKYQRIESYEDTLNNIEFNEPEHQNLLMDEHQLNYILESDTKESPAFLNISKLQNPFSYQLKIVKDMQTQKQDIDLPETFNYLIGLSVQNRRCLYDDGKRYLVYKGTVEQKTVVVIWRETAGWEQEDYERDYNFIQEHQLIEGAAEVYVNTDSNIPEAKSLDPLFKRLMFQ